MFFTVRQLPRRQTSQTMVTSRSARETDRNAVSAYVDIENVNFDENFEQFHSQSRQKLQEFQPSTFGCKVLLFIILISGIFSVFTMTTFLLDGDVSTSGEGDPFRKFPHLTSNTAISETKVITDPYELLTALQASPDELLKIPRIAEHCHRPEHPVTGMEGFANQGLKLEQVHLILSPGEVTPPGPLSTSISFKHCSFKNSKFGYRELESFPESINKYLAFNKNIRNFQNMASLNLENEQCIQDQITPLGTAQHIGLGKYFQSLYLNKWNLHDNDRLGNSWLHIRSLDSGHIIHSLLGFLHGFLKQEQIHSVGMHQVESGFCEDLAGICDCSSKYQYIPLVENITSATNSTSIINKFRISDSLAQREVTRVVMPFICNKQLPKPADSHEKKVNITSRDMEQILSLTDSHFHAITNDDSFTDVADLNAFPFMMKLMNQFKQGQEELPQKVFIYGSDDSFMLSILATIRLSLEKLLRPASRLVFEVYSSNKDGKLSRYLRVLLNGEDITMRIPLCHRRHGESMCPLKYFVDYHLIKFKRVLPNGC